MDAELTSGIIRHIEYTNDLTNEQKMCILTRVIVDKDGYAWTSGENPSKKNIIHNCPNVKSLLGEMIKINAQKDEKTGNSLLLKMCDDNAKFVDTFIGEFLSKETQEIDQMLNEMFSDI